MTVYRPVTVTVVAVLVVVSFAYLGPKITALLSAIGIMAALVHGIEPNLGSHIQRKGED